MRVAALYDVHGNLPALEAVLAEVEGEAADLVVVGGDVVWGPMPSETLELLRGLGERVLFIRGNADREVAEGMSGPDFPDNVTAWCAGRLRARELEFLGRLPHRAAVDVGGLGRVLFCHGSPRRDDEPITATTTEARLERILAGVEEDVVVFGHTHGQVDRVALGKRLVNPGSVGLPFGEPAAHWALLGPDVELRRTVYDREAAAARFRGTGVPAPEWFVEQILSPPPADASLRFEPSR